MNARGATLSKNKIIKRSLRVDPQELHVDTAAFGPSGPFHNGLLYNPKQLTVAAHRSIAYKKWFKGYCKSCKDLT